MASTMAQDAIFSGPQPGEPITPFVSVDIVGETPGKERNILEESQEKPNTLVFVHGLERSMLPLMRVVDDYTARHKDKVQTDFVFLSESRVEGMERFARALNSIRLKGRSTLSVDGIEGPGNYGLNKACLLTILVASNRTAHANFALVQPGIADADRVLAAIAKVIGDPKPPTREEILASSERRPAAGRGESMRPGNPTPNMATPQKDPFPGAVPTDGQLTNLLRQFIRKTNEDARVDEILNEVRAHIRDQPDLEKQAIGGWTRVLHFGDRYGTDYARKVGAAFLEELRKKHPETSP